MILVGSTQRFLITARKRKKVNLKRGKEKETEGVGREEEENKNIVTPPTHAHESEDWKQKIAKNPPALPPATASITVALSYNCRILQVVVSRTGRQGNQPPSPTAAEARLRVVHGRTEN